MVNVTFSLPEDTVKRLRKVALRRGKGHRGAISELVNVAIQEHLAEVESRDVKEEFRAAREGRVLARASSLRELAAELRRLRLDPRDVKIESSTPLEPTVRTGIRGDTR